MRSSRLAAATRRDLGHRRPRDQDGVSPVLIDLMRRGYVSALAMNGAGIIHDFEVALVGATSEDVDRSARPGRFGMAEETGRLLNQIIVDAAAQKRGFGQAVGIPLEAAPLIGTAV
jgi:hypothetical protein